MRDDLRKRREQHLMLVRQGIPYTERCQEIADRFGVKVKTVQKDDDRMDEWIDDVANTASFERKSAFLLYQHRSQTEAHEQLAQNSRQERRHAEQRVAELQERIEEVERQEPRDMGLEESDYYQLLTNLQRQLSTAKDGIIKWTREERHQRTQVADNTTEEFELRQSLGEIEQIADEVSVQMDQRVEERKVFAGVDFTEFPGMEQARLVGADLEETDAPGVSIDIEDDG